MAPCFLGDTVMERKFVPGKVYFRNKITGNIVDYEPMLDQVSVMERVIPNPIIEKATEPKSETKHAAPKSAPKSAAKKSDG